MKRRLRLALFASLLAAVAAAPGVAQGQGYYADDEPIRQTVARLAYISGDISFARGDDPDDWQPADPNFPMTLGDRVWTAGGRLELQVHGGHMIRLASKTDLTALNLTEDTKQFSLSAGVASFRIQRLGNDEIFEVDTPNAAITFERPGDYRVDIRPDGDTRFQVRRGRALIASAGGQIALSSGDAIVIEGYDPPRYDVIDLPHPDGWDGWVVARDDRYGKVRSYEYVSADIAGVGDLDYYGRWQQVPSYGWCWSPTSVASGWAPYRAGRWVWQDPWGWTWVSTEPWGWAPYHYGRWVTWSSRWYWVPVAPSVSVVAYSPALVAFVGGGPGFSISVGTGPGYVGWFPLAPRDPLIPWWGRPAVNVNVTNITYVNRTYVTVVNQNTFVQSRIVSSNIVRDRNVLTRVAQAPVVRGTVPIVPTRQSIRVSARTSRATRPPANVSSRSVVARVAPPAAPARFDQKLAVIRETRAPVSRQESARLVRGETPRASRPVRSVASESGNVALRPRSENSRGPKPEPVAPVKGRTMATRERPVAAPAAEAPSRATDRDRNRVPDRPETVDRNPQTREAPPARDTAERDRAARETESATRERYAREQAAREQSQREQTQRETAARERATREQATRDQATREKAARDQSQREQAQRETAARERATREQATREQATREKAAREKAARDESAARERSQRAAPTARPQSSERPAPERPATSERARPAPRAREAEAPPARVAPTRGSEPKTTKETETRKAPERGRPRQAEPTKKPS